MSSQQPCLCIHSDASVCVCVWGKVMSAQAIACTCDSVQPPPSVLYETGGGGGYLKYAQWYIHNNDDTVLHRLTSL